MIPPCLYNIVGLRGSCDCNCPKSGLFVNDLPRLSLEQFAAAANGEQIRGEQLFKTLLQEATLTVLNHFRGKLSESFNFKKVLQRKVVGKAGDFFDDVYEPKGIIVERNCDECYQLVRIEKLTFRAKDRMKVNCYIEDEYGNKKTIPFVSKQGLNILRIDYCTTEAVKISFDECLQIASVDSSLCGCGGSCACNTCGMCNFDIEQCTFQDGEWKIGGNGIKVDASIICDDTDLICAFANELAFPIRMMIGVKYMQNVSTNTAINPIIRNGKEDAKEILRMWLGGEDRLTGEKIPSEYWSLLSPVVKQAKQYLTTVRNECITCNESIEYIEKIP